MAHIARAIISNAVVVFFDFDGVIKDSVDVKTSAFEKLFLPYGQKIVQNVKLHHEANGGVSRFEKIPLYLTWAGETVTDKLVNDFCDRFSDVVLQSVIDSPWVPGVREYLLENSQQKYFVLVTATPQGEIEEILSTLMIDQSFREIYGAPTKKEVAIQSVLEKQKVMPDQALMIGDSETDLLAAKANSVTFLLRQTPQNLHLQSRYDGPKFDDLSYE